MNLKLDNKVALVTGGSRGIGRAIALELASEGCRVGICARNRDGLDATLAEIRDRGAEAFGTTADVSRPGEAERFVVESAGAFGEVDILVSNVGGSSGRILEESTDEDWAKTFDLNLFHAVRATRAALPHFVKGGGGSVIIISSISGWKPAPSGAQYGCAKAAEMFLAGALAWELGPHNVRVNTVCPGSTIFPGGGWANRRDTDPEGFGEFEKREFPTGRLGSPEEIADAVVFLASERASWINGASIPVDGAQGRPSMF
ncbi:MAG: SDR family oxidoreductase [Candidatus Latescibacteria bacterium]|jgi:3-oxoacyl-[acyl-carrier protein] reductase|nr:SDR family oxidoreductase [Candidatus Latescibacterota bacterium]